MKVLSTALLRFLHWRKEWETEPAAWVGSVLLPLLLGSVLQPLPAPPRSQLLKPLPWLFPLHPQRAFPSIALGLQVHPPIPAGSVPTTGCWLVGPGQEASSLCSPQAEWHHPGVSPGALQLCSLSFAPTSSLAPQMLYRPKYCPLHQQGIISHPLNPLWRVCPTAPGLGLCLTLSCVQPVFVLPTQTLRAESHWNPNSDTGLLTPISQSPAFFQLWATD